MMNTSVIDPFPLRTKLMMDFVRRMASPQDIDGLPAGIDLSDLMRVQEAPEAESERFRLCRIAIDGALRSQKYQKADDHVTDFVNFVSGLSATKADYEKRLEEKLKKAAKLQMIHDFIAVDDDRRGLSDEIWRRLKAACGDFLRKQKASRKSEKPKDGKNQTARLSDGMMAIIREDGDIRLVASLAPRGIGGIKITRMGGGAGSSFAPLMELMEDVPDCPFVVIPFQNSTFTLNDIVVNVPEQFRGGHRGFLYLTGGATIDLALADDLVAFFDSFQGLGKAKKSQTVESRLYEYFTALRTLRSALSDFSVSVVSGKDREKVEKNLQCFPDQKSAAVMDLIARLPDCSDGTNYTWEVLKHFLFYSVKKKGVSQ